MYAVIETGGKQYKVSEGDIIFIEKLEVNEGDVITLDKVVAVSDENGIKVASEIGGANVSAKVLKNGKEKKVIVYKYKAKKNERRKQGHRQPFSTLKVCEIVK